MRSFKTFNNIRWGDLRAHTEFAGKHSVIVDDKDHVKSWTGYDLPDGYVMRVFKREDWQGTPIDVAAFIQNIFWIYGLAPRVRACIKFKDPSSAFWTHIVEYLPAGVISNPGEMTAKLLQIAKDNFIEPYVGLHNEMKLNLSNWRGSKYIDYGGFKCINEEAYKQKLIAKIDQVTHFGKSYKGRRASYQSIPEWGVDGKRKTDYRVDKMGLQHIVFTNKSILDVGCNLGMMLHYSRSKGATKFTGYDLPNIIEVAREFANYQKVFNIDFYAQDLRQEPPKEKADIVFFLAMNQYLGFPKWLGELTNEICFFEGHADEQASTTEQQLKQLFPKVEYVGTTDDRSVRHLFKCSK
jgi:hypothetical protein